MYSDMEICSVYLYKSIYSMLHFMCHGYIRFMKYGYKIVH